MANIAKPPFSQIAEGKLAGSLGLIQPGDFISEFVKSTAGQSDIFGLE